MPGARGDMVGRIITLSAAGNSLGAAGTIPIIDDLFIFEVPARCILMDIDTTGTAAVSVGQRVADTTGTLDVNIRNATSNSDLLRTVVTVPGPGTDNDGIAEMDGVVVTTEAQLILEAGEWLAVDVDAVTLTTGVISVAVHLMGI